jgi:transcriptional regulator with XRE-family HTH domain
MTAERPSITPAQCRAARALLDWSQTRLSAESGVGEKTIVDFEQGKRKPFARTIRDLREALERPASNSPTAQRRDCD